MLIFRVESRAGRPENKSIHYTSILLKPFDLIFLDQIYRVSDMELVRVLPSAEDEVNVACFHPFTGGGLVYGTKVNPLLFFYLFLSASKFSLLLYRLLSYFISYICRKES